MSLFVCFGRGDHVSTKFKQLEYAFKIKSYSTKCFYIQILFAVGQLSLYFPFLYQIKSQQKLRKYVLM